MPDKDTTFHVAILRLRRRSTEDLVALFGSIEVEPSREGLWARPVIGHGQPTRGEIRATADTGLSKPVERSTWVEVETSRSAKSCPKPIDDGQQRRLALRGGRGCKIIPTTRSAQVRGNPGTSRKWFAYCASRPPLSQGDEVYRDIAPTNHDSFKSHQASSPSLSRNAALSAADKRFSVNVSSTYIELPAVRHCVV